MKNLISTFLCFACFSLIVSAQTSLLPEPALKYSCDEITNNHELAPTVGSITALITSGENATTYKTDALIENDSERGDVLFLPNTVDGAGKGDAAAYYRSLRIISNQSLVGTGNFTISFWTKVKTQTTLNGFPAVLDFDAMSSGRSFSMRNYAHWHSNKLSLRFNDGSNKDLNTNLAPADFVYDWTNYVIVKSGTKLSLYVNSVLRASSTTYNLANSELKQLRFNGQAHGGGSLFDDIQIFHTALDADQIAELFGVPEFLEMKATFENATNDSLVKGSKWHEPTLFTVEPSITDNPDKTGLNTSDMCFLAQSAFSGWWGNFGELALKNPVTITESNRYLKFMAYRSAQTHNFRVAINGDHGDVYEIYQGKLGQDGTWEYVVIDLGPKLMGFKLKSLVFVYHCDWSGGAADNSIHAFDNFELSDNIDIPLTVSVSAYPIEGGSIAGSSGAGYYSPGQNLVLNAVANTGYTFIGWYLDGTQVSELSDYAPVVSGNIPLNYIAYFKKDADVYPNVEVKGTYYVIEDLEKGKQIFRNREFPLEDIPAGFSGWNYIKVSARSSSAPVGDANPPAIEIKPLQTGYIYAMVANKEQSANAQTWATDNAWELLPVHSLAYGVNDPNKVLSFYRKEFAGNVWYTMIFPDVFSRATIIAPVVGEEDTLSTDIKDLTLEKTVLSEIIFTLSGIRVSSDVSKLSNGIYITKTVYSDGSSDSKKIAVSQKK